jgi:Caspase domain
MANFVRASSVWLAVLVALLLGQHSSLAQEVRFALVIGNDQYRAATLATPANDAGLVADALGAAGFAVTGARNLDQAALRETFREFIGQVASAGPNAVAVIYLAGFGLQFEGENYFVPIDADIQRDVDAPRRFGTATAAARAVCAADCRGTDPDFCPPAAHRDAPATAAANDERARRAGRAGRQSDC